jgi:hypothetical protein
MRNPLMVLLAASLVLAGCGGWGDSRANPRNWFGKSSTTAAVIPQDASAINPLIPKKSAISKRPDAVDASVAIAAVTELRVERTTTGAIIHVTGVAARQGAYKAELRLDPVDEANPSDILSFTFRVVYPKDPTPVGSERTRTVYEAQTLTTQDLQGIRLIRVKGAQNSMETRRR